MGKNIVIKVENLSKVYQLGQFGTGTISRDLERFWEIKIRGKEDPFLKIGQMNDRASKSESDIVWSVKDINFEIEQGDAVGIIGRNGAGKSTLLKLLSRVTAPTTGIIKVKGRIASLLEVGTGFHPELTGRENIYLNGAILGMRKNEILRKFDEIVDFSGVERYIDTPVKRYSSGMYVRLAFGVAAHLESEILIVDEVLAVGDAEFQSKCLGKMGEVSKGEGRTVLFVSHNLTSVANLCTRGVLMDKGVNVYSGGIDNCIKEYLTYGVKDEMIKINDIYPNTEEFKLIDFTVRSNTLESNNFYTNKTITIIVNFEIRKFVNGLRIGFDLYEVATGNHIFRTFHDDNNSLKVKLGKNSFIGEIPENILKQGDYEIKLAVGIHNVRWITTDKIIRKFTILNIFGVNNKYADRRPGAIMPLIKWK